MRHNDQFYPLFLSTFHFIDAAISDVCNGKEARLSAWFDSGCREALRLINDGEALTRPTQTAPFWLGKTLN